jgi:hypothetical protein
MRRDERECITVQFCTVVAWAMGSSVLETKGHTPRGLMEIILVNTSYSLSSLVQTLLYSKPK